MINKKDVNLLNITLKVSNENLVPLENYLKDNFNLIDFSIVADTSKMYEKDNTFKKIVQESKKIKDIRLDYINNHNSKYN